MPISQYELILMRSAISPSISVRSALTNAITTSTVPLNSKLLRFLSEALRYAEVTGSAITSEVSGELGPIISQLGDPIGDPSAPVWALSRLEYEMQKQSLSATLLRTMELLQTPDTDEPSLNKALSYLTTNLPKPKVSVEDESVDLGKIYLERKGRTHGGLTAGFDPINKVTDGHQPGELFITAGYAGVGKSMFLQNISYLRRMDGKNGVYVSTEQTKAQIVKRLAIRHSNHERFGLPRGISDSQVKRAELPSELEAIWLNEIIPDWTQDLTNSYGKLEVIQVAANTTLGTILILLEDMDKRVKLDYVVIDYLSMLLPTNRKGDNRIIQSNLYIEAQSIAKNFAGRQIAVWTAAQTNPASMQQANKTGRYDIRAVAETAEAERSADLLMYLLRRPEEVETRRLKAGLLKYRDGRSDLDFFLDERYDNSYLGDTTRMDSADSAWSPKI